MHGQVLKRAWVTQAYLNNIGQEQYLPHTLTLDWTTDGEATKTVAPFVATGEKTIKKKHTIRWISHSMLDYKRPKATCSRCTNPKLSACPTWRPKWELVLAMTVSHFHVQGESPDTKVQWVCQRWTRMNPLLPCGNVDCPTQSNVFAKCNVQFLPHVVHLDTVEFTIQKASPCYRSKAHILSLSPLGVTFELAQRNVQ